MGRIPPQDFNNNTLAFPTLPYIAYVPWYPPFQQRRSARGVCLSLSNCTTKHDALYRARALGIPWVSFFDVDDYLQLMEGSVPSHGLTASKSVVHNPNLGALEVSSAGFGKGHRDAPAVVLLDY